MLTKAWPNYGTGRMVTKDGYIGVLAPGHPLADKRGYVLEHRMLAWDAGLFSDPSLDVHHKNAIKDDNRLDNLMPITKAEHTALHRGMIRIP